MSSPEPIAFVDGRFVPASELAIPATDAGFVMGITLAEQLRTFGGEIFAWDEHFLRLNRGLAHIGGSLDTDYFATKSLRKSAEQLIDHNFQLLAPGDDLGVTLFVTPGTYAAYAQASESQPMVGMHTFPLAFDRWAIKYESGQRLVQVQVRQTSNDNWPLEIKNRSRMHYHLATLEARSIDPQSAAVLFHADGAVSETPIANLLVYKKDVGLISPPRHRILPGVTLEVTRKLAEQLSIPWSEKDLTANQLLEADEILLVSTPFCLIAATSFNGTEINGGHPGRVFSQLLAAWNEMVQIDIPRQANRFRQR